jgi:adenine-specific DNA-methyltransferase
LVNCLGLPRDEKNLSRYSNPDNDSRGEWQSSTMTVSNGTNDYLYSITTPSGRVVRPPEGRFWVYNKKRYHELVEDGRIWFGREGQGVPRIKTFLSEVNQRVNPLSIWSHIEVGHSQGATQDLKKLFDDKKYFDYPKPVKLIKRCLDLYVNKEDLVLDFFSGSGTTAHSVFEANSEDCGLRKFILVQLPEQLDNKSDAFKNGYKTIADIGKERIRKAGAKIKEENPLHSANLDTGFKVFKLDSSNIKGWDGDPDNIENNLFKAQENIKTDRTEEDVLFEILLKYGLDLTLPIEQKDIEGKKVFNIGFGALFICLSDNITSNVAEGIGKWKEELKPQTCRVIFKDAGFNDKEKANSLLILKRFGIQEIKSI